MVHLVEDHERATVEHELLVHRGLDGHLGVGDGHTVVVPSGSDVTIAEGGVQANRHPGGGIRPLRLQVLGRGDHDDAVDDVTPQQFRREAQRERGLAGAGGRGSEEVARTGTRTVGAVHREVQVERFRLPGTQTLCGAPRSALRVRGREVLGREAPEVSVGRMRAVGGRRLVEHGIPPCRVIR